MKKIILFTLLALTLLKLSAQNEEVLVTAKFNNVTFNQFVEKIETLYPVSFYFLAPELNSIRVTESFSQQPLEACLLKVLKGTNLKISILNGQVFIYSGQRLNQLFVNRPAIIEDSPAQKTREELSRERLLAKQYELMNIGVPGASKSNFAIISGTVGIFNQKATVPGCNVYTKEDRRGTSTDKNGKYELRLPLGNHTIIYSSVGMESTQRQVHLYADGNLNVEMETKVNLLGDVEVLGNDNGNLERVEVGMERIDMKTVKNLPKLLGQPDIIKSTLVLPGVTTVGEGASGFNVRGGKTDQNLILIDQTPVYYPTHFFGNFSAINSDLVEHANLYKGSFPVHYGGRISSVYQLDTKHGNRQKMHGTGGISPLAANLMLEGPIVKGKSSYLLSLRGTYSNWVLKQIDVDELYNSKADFGDVYTKFDFSLNKKSSLFVSLYGSADEFKLKSDTTYNYKNILGEVGLNTRFNEKWTMLNSLSASIFGYDISSKTDALKAFNITHSLQNYLFKNHVEFQLSEKAKMHFGGELQAYFIEPGEQDIPEGSELIPFHTETERALEYATFVGLDLKPIERLKLETGIRWVGFMSLADGRKHVYKAGLPLSETNLLETIETSENEIEKTYGYPEFRFSSNFSLSRYTALKFSYNITTQFLHLLTNTTAISPTDTWKLSDEYLQPQRGHLFSAGLVRSNYRNTLEMSVEGFYKRMHHMKEYKAGASLLLNDHVETEILDGDGKSYGVEFSLHKKTGRVNGRIGYTYARTLIKTESEFEEELINGGEYFPANYDKPHQLNVIANWEPVRGFVLSAMTNYSTGRPITYPVTKYKLGNQVILHYSDYNQYRIPDYFRVDVSLTIDRNLKKDKLFDGSWSFSVYNLTGRRNAYSVYYRSMGNHYNAYKLSIFGAAIPTVTYNFKF